MFNNFFFNRVVYEIMLKNIIEPGRPQMTIWRMRIAWSIPKATDTHSEYVILIAFPLQQWLHQRAWMLRYTYLPVLFNLAYVIISEHVEVQLVEALRHKPEGRGFGSWWCHCSSSLTYPSDRNMVLGSTKSLTEMSTRNIFEGKGGRCVELTILLLSCVDHVEICESQCPVNLNAFTGIPLSLCISYIWLC